MWELIDCRMDSAMLRASPDSILLVEDRSYLLGAAEMLATFLNPYIPDVDAIRTQAVSRWEERQEST
jgi:hypothetical protein